MKTRIGWSLLAVFLACGVALDVSAVMQSRARDRQSSNQPRLVYAGASRPDDSLKISGRTDIQHMAFYGAQVTDDQVALVDQSHDLQVLTLLNCSGVTDEALTHIAQHTTLKRLMVDGAQVTDAGLAKLAALTNLEDLTLGDLPNVTDQGLAVLSSLPNLKRLVIGGGRFTGSGLSQLAAPEKLEFLSLYGRGVSDETVPVLARLTNLTSLNLYDTAITDRALQTVAGLAKLEHVWLVKTNVTDAGIKQLASLTALKELDCQKTQVTVAGITPFQNKNLQFWSGTDERDYMGGSLLSLKLLGAWLLSGLVLVGVMYFFRLPPLFGAEK